MRQETGEPYFRIDSREAYDMVKKGEGVVVDVRNEDEYLSGHAKGALFIPVDDIMFRFQELPKDKKLLFICASGVRSGLAAEMAAANGIDQSRLYNVEDGTATWIANRLPASTGDTP